MEYNGLFVGLTTLDIQYFVELFPPSNVKLKTQPPDILVGGPATNAAVAFAKLNGSAILASAFGTNAFSKFTQKDFKQTKLKHFDLQKNIHTNPVLATVVTSVANGDRNIFTSNPNDVEVLFSAKELFDKTSPDILLLDGFYPGFSIECAKIANANKIPIVLDAGSWKPQFETLLELANVVICSEDFFPPGCTTVKEVLQYLKCKGINKAAISRGSGNIIFFENSEPGEIPIDKSKIVDTLGAGDFLHGAFCYYYLQHKNFKSGLLQASKLATFTCSYAGTRSWLNHF